MRGLLAHGAVLSLLFAVALLVAPSPARAWTDATVRSAHAEVELTPDGRAHVTLWARVRVDGGWLEGLELEGLDEDAALDPEHPLTFRDANGIALPVEVTPREGGRVSLRFARRSAPRRGEYDFDLAWTTGLSATRALDADTLEARWLFPAWRYGLDAVEIRWIVPPGASPQPADEITAPVEIETSAVDDGTDRLAVIYRRAHLPRTSDWETLVRVPRAAWAHTSALEIDEPATVDAQPMVPTQPSQPTAAPIASSDEGAREIWLGLGLALAIGAWIKRRDLDARATRARHAHELLVPTSRLAHTIVAVCAAVLAIVAHALAWDPAASLLASALVVGLTWQRSRQGAPRPRVLPLSPVGAAEIVRARRERVLEWIGLSSWLEPGRLGLVTVGIVLALSTRYDAFARLHAGLLVALVASGTRARLGALPTASIRRLTSAMDRLRVDLAAPYLSLRLLGRGAQDPVDVRIHLSLHAEPPSTRILEDLRMEIVDDAGTLQLRVAAREATAADVALRAWAESEGVALHELARRRAVLVPLTDRAVGPSLERITRGILALAPREHDVTMRDELLLAAE